jgi:hypothetical protein
MDIKIIQDLLQLFIIFGCLSICLVVLVLGMIYLDRNALSIKKRWKARWDFVRETDWLGVFIIVGLILLFMCNGPIIIF